VTAARPPLVAVLLAAAVTLILIGRAGAPLAGEAGALRSAGRAAFGPVESVGDGLFRPWRAVRAAIAGGGDLARAESALVRARGEVRSEAARAAGLEAENARLAALLSLNGPAAPDGLVARVVSLGAGPGDTLALDRGSEAGVRVGMPVVAAGGLVGRVVEVAPRFCTVLPVAGSPSAVGVRIGASGTAGVASGRGGWRLPLELLDSGAAVRAGDVAVTAGLRHSVFPAGLPVGLVAGAPGHFVVEGFAPPARLEVVKILRWTPEP
jgi:cell shape-determining protein MreC